MSVDRVKLYKVELRPPKGWDKDKAQEYQRKLLISTKIESYPFLTFSNKLRPCEKDIEDDIRRKILDKRDPSLPLNAPLRPNEQKEFDGRVKYNCSWVESDDVLEKRGDEIVRLLKVVAPSDLLTKGLIRNKYLKPLSPTSGKELVQFLYPSPPPIKIEKREAKAGRTMTFVLNPKVFQSAIASDFNKLFISPWGDLQAPTSTGIIGLHIAIKKSGLRVLEKIRKMENVSRKALQNDVEHDLGRFLIGKTSKYVNHLRFNKALKATASLKPITDNYKNVSYHPITNIKRERITSGTFTQKEWLLKGRVYDDSVFEALCPVLGREFGYSIWKLWAERTQKALDKHMSQFDLKDLSFSGTEEEAYASTIKAVPSVSPLPQRKSSAAAVVSVKQAQQTNITPALITTLKQKIASLRSKLVANFKFDDLVTSISGVGETTVKNILKSLGRTDADQLASIITFKGLYWVMRNNGTTFASLGLSDSKRKLFEDAEAAFLKEDTMQNYKPELTACDTLLQGLENDLRKKISSGVYTFKGSNPILIVNGNITLFEFTEDGLEQYLINEIKVCAPLLLFETRNRIIIMLRDELFKLNKSYNGFVRYQNQIYRVVSIGSDRTILLIDSDDNTFRVGLDDVQNLTDVEKQTAQAERDQDQTVNENALQLQRQQSQDEEEERKRKQKEETKQREEQARLEAEKLAEKQRKEREQNEALLKQQEEAAQAELKEAQKKLLGTPLERGEKLSVGDWYPLSQGDKILFYVKKPNAEPSVAEKELFLDLQAAKSPHITKVYYLPQQKSEDGKTVLSIREDNYSFDFDEEGDLLVTEYAGTPLADTSDIPLTDIDKSSVIASAIKAVSDLHDLGYFHGDIKLENLTLMDSIVKIIDFGQTESFRSLDKYYKEKKENIQTDTPEDDAAQWRKLWADDTQYNGDMMITPPFSGDVISKKIDDMSVLFKKNISIKNRLILHDQWMLAHAMLHLGNKHMKPFDSVSASTDKERLSRLLFDGEKACWFQQNPRLVPGGNIRTSGQIEQPVLNRCIKPLQNLIRTDDKALEIFKLLYLVFQGGAKGKEIDEDMSIDSLKGFLTVNITDDILVSLATKWISGHHNLSSLQKTTFKCPSLEKLRGGNDDEEEEIDFESDIGLYLYGISAKDIKKLFKPLYDKTVGKDGKAKFDSKNKKFNYQEKQSFFDYDSFSDGELNELDTQMEAMDDDELERLISEEINVSYDSASDTGNSNAAYSYDSSSDTGNSNVAYDSSSDTGNSNVAYDSSSDTGNSNAAFSYNSESEQSASESLNDNAYNSDSDEDR